MDTWERGVGSREGLGLEELTEVGISLYIGDGGGR